MPNQNQDLLKSFLLANGINNASITTMLREFLEGGGATPTVSWDDVTDKPTFSAVATSGSYNDLSNTPSLSAVATSGDYADLTGTPTLATVATSGSYNDLSDTPTLGTAASADVGDFATAAQGTLASSAVQPGDLAAVATSGDSADVSTPEITSAGGNFVIAAGTVVSALQAIADQIDPAP